MYLLQIALIVVSIVIVFFQALYLKLKYSPKKEIIKKIPLPLVRLVHVLTYSLGVFYIVFSSEFFSAEPLFEGFSLWLILGSLLIVLLSRKTLGINYSPDVEVHKNHEYISTGIYRYLSHPVYYAEIIAALGTCFLINHAVYYFAGFPLFVFAQLVKIKAENSLLASHFTYKYETQSEKLLKLLTLLKKPFFSVRLF
jgi:protein-S-isoprenylcysteine O-methyltransferase Ste14